MCLSFLNSFQEGYKMRETEFERLKKDSESFFYTSLEHTEYVDIQEYDVFQNDQNGVFIVGWNKEKKLNEIHWSVNQVEPIVDFVKNRIKPLILTFIPDGWVDRLKKEGFEIFGIWNDFFKESIKVTESLAYSETLSEKDAEAISQLTLSCRGTSRGFTGQSPSFCRDWISDHPRSVLSNSNDKAVIGYKDDDKLVGCVFVAIYGKIKTLWIREIAVDPEYQNRGIGRYLIRQAFSYALERGARRSFLAADECNENAIHLYQSLGYVGNPKDRQIDMILEK
jgi:ribosomal protein S18 acetylase RimI-like enzyme